VGFVFQSPTLAGLKIELPSSLLAMVTGGFYVWHLDNVELDTRPSRRWEIGCQAVLTGLCGLVAATVAWEVILGDASLAIDKILLTAVINAAVGFVLAWYIPQAAAATRYDPLIEAREERIRMLEAATRTRFADPSAATAWLARPHAALDNRSPKAAAAEVEGFEQAMSLLQGPRAWVA
jgi:antitoxin Xre/MbcA/ParS-like protein